MTKKPINSVLDMSDDPVVSRLEWRPVIEQFFTDVTTAVPINFVKLMRDQPTLYFAIKNQEAKFDEMKSAPLSEVLTIAAEWRRLIVYAEHNSTPHAKPFNQERQDYLHDGPRKNFE